MLKRDEFLLSKGFHEKCRHTELALNVIQKQKCSPKTPLFFDYSQRVTPRFSKKLFLKFSFFKGTLRP